MLFLLISIAVIAFCIYRGIKTDGEGLVFLLAFVTSIILFLINIFFFANGLLCRSEMQIERWQIQQEYLDAHADNQYLAGDILEWNQDLATNKRLEHSPWIGIYVPNIYDQFHFVDKAKE